MWIEADLQQWTTVLFVNTAVMTHRYQNGSFSKCFSSFSFSSGNLKPKAENSISCLLNFFPPKRTGVVISKNSFLLLSWYSHIHKDVGFFFFECFIHVKKTLVYGSLPSSLFSLERWVTCQQITFSNSLADQNVPFDRFLSPTAAALEKKMMKQSCHHGNMFLFLYIFLSEDKRPHGDDYPGWLHHDLQPDPNWDNPLPEAPQTCGPGEADGLYFHGRPTTQCSYLHNCTRALWPTSSILCI